MRLGLLSDTHDNLPSLQGAVSAFKERGVEHVLHAGDITTPATLERFAGWDTTAIFGNNDLDREALLRSAKRAGVNLDNGWEGFLGGIRLAMLHGDNRSRLNRAIVSGHFRLVVTGHTHRLRDELVGNTRVINPGALYRAARHTCVVYDTNTDLAEVVDVK